MAAIACHFQSSLVPLLVLTSGASVASLDRAAEAFPAPKGFDAFYYCSACGPHNQSEDQGCTSRNCTACRRTPGKRCYPSGDRRYGCCCDPQMPKEDEFNCVRSVNNGTCTWSCCQVHTYKGHAVMPPICGNGCCKPSDRGIPFSCGMNLRTKGKRKHANCCVFAAANPDEQTNWGCCKEGVGIDCRAPRRDQPCCLWQSPEYKNDSYPYLPCQPKSCSAYQPCDYGIGVDCIGRSGFPRSIGTIPCCLPFGVPSVHDACQRDEAACKSTFAPCHDGYGMDCASESKGACCLPPGSPEQGACRKSLKSCDDYNWEQSREKLDRWGRIAGIALACVVLLACAWWLLRRPIKALVGHCSRSCCRRNGSREVLLASGEIVHVAPLIEHPRRLALVIWCSSYNEGYDVLRGAKKGAEKLEGELRHIGYDHVEVVPDATDSNMNAGFLKILQRAEGVRQPLIVIYYAGHAAEIGGTLLWAGIHARKDQTAGHFDVTDICRQLQEVHRVNGPKPFGFQGIIEEAFFVFLADCCRTPPAIEDAHGHLVSLCAPAASWTMYWRRKPSFYFVYATEPGATAADEVESSGLSPFIQGLLKHMRNPQRLDSLFSAFSAELEESTGGHQRPCRREVCGRKINCVSLAPLGSREGPSRSSSHLGGRPESAASSASTEAPTSR